MCDCVHLLVEPVPIGGGHDNGNFPRGAKGVKVGERLAHTVVVPLRRAIKVSVHVFGRERGAQQVGLETLRRTRMRCKCQVPSAYAYLKLKVPLREAKVTSLLQVLQAYYRFRPVVLLHIILRISQRSQITACCTAVSGAPNRFGPPLIEITRGY